MAGDFGPLAGVVRRCEWVARHLRCTLIGGAGSGKTLSALRLASGLRSEGNGIALLSCGEAGAEAFYAQVTEFVRLDASDPQLVELARRAYSHERNAQQGWGDFEGTDPRAVVVAINHLSAGVGRGGVLIVDSLSDVWDGTKSRVDDIKGGDEKKNGLAWGIWGRLYNEVIQAIELAGCHVIATIRAKTEVETQKRGRATVAIHTPTGQKLRNKDEFRLDLRVWLDSEHNVVSVGGRFNDINEQQEARRAAGSGWQITEDFGRWLRGRLDGPAVVAVAAPVEAPPASREGQPPERASNRPAMTEDQAEAALAEHGFPTVEGARHPCLAWLMMARSAAGAPDDGGFNDDRHRAASIARLLPSRVEQDFFALAADQGDEAAAAWLKGQAEKAGVLAMDGSGWLWAMALVGQIAKAVQS